MNLSDFQYSITVGEKPSGLGPDLEALWEDGAGNWDRAHDLAQLPGAAYGDRIHAYLHRKEGDLMNAGYWYRRCGLSTPTQPLSEEWESLVLELLN